jgi:hypothetical protein
MLERAPAADASMMLLCDIAFTGKEHLLKAADLISI